MLLEMHSHTAEYSPCSSVAAVELVRQVFARGLQGVVLTDHHHLWLPQDIKSLRRAAEIPDHFVILSGQEVSTSDYGDVLVYGATETLLRHTSLAEIRRTFPEAALVWAHPYRNNREPTDRKLLDSHLDAIEIFNSNHTARGNSRGLQDWHRLRFRAIAGTDTHGKSYAGTYPTIFDHPVATERELAEEIRQGRCRPFLKEIPRAGATANVLEVTIGTKGTDDVRERIIIRNLKNAEKWSSAARGFAIMEAVAAHGFSSGLFRVPRPIDADAGSQVVIEQGLRGKSLFDKLLAVAAGERTEYLRLAGRWLAHLHNCRLIVTPPEEFLAREVTRLERYHAHFTGSRNPHTSKFADIMEDVRGEEESIVAREQATFVQGHGDYHPKNIFIGHDVTDNRNTLYVAAIDFESSMVMPPAFDLGCFLAQFRNQFFSHPEILRDCPETVVLEGYLQDAENPPPQLMRQVELFRARTNLSIASYLIDLGLGEGENLWRVLVEAEKALAVYHAAQTQA